MNDTMDRSGSGKECFPATRASMTGVCEVSQGNCLAGSFFRFMSEQSPALVVMEACGAPITGRVSWLKLGHASEAESRRNMCVRS